MVLGLVMGGPLAWLMLSAYILARGSWSARGLWTALSAVLAYHPLPGKSFAAALNTSWFVSWLYKYFSYRFVWCDDDRSKCRASSAWFGAGPPHGVLPFANILSIPAINTFTRPFVGAPASVVFRTPFLRYMTLFGCVPVDGKSISKATAAGLCVGIVPDGIAGIFQCSNKDEVVAIKNKKGLARLALKTGTPIVPAYSFGNTEAFSAWYDPFGFMEAASRKTQASMFIFWGRFGLPIPRRTQITMGFGAPIEVEKTENPTEEQINKLHERFLLEIQQTFDRHKTGLGWGHKEMKFV
jgi:2-acylglycerol O-acyltransferase 2